MLVYPKRQPFEAWQCGSGFPPEWTDNCLNVNDDGELVITRRSGKQIINSGEWLLKSADSSVLFYTDAEMQKLFDFSA